MIKRRSFFLSGIFSLFILLVFLQPATAGMVGTANLLPDIPQQTDLSQARQDIQIQLVELGVDQLQAATRVANLSDSQINEITQKISEAPAGASAGGVILTIFIVLVVTDIIGATDVFPFITPVR